MIFYNLVILIKLYKIRYLNLDQALLFLRNQANTCLKIKNFDQLQLPQRLIFLPKFCTGFLLNNVYKSLFGIFFIFFRSWVINKTVKSKCVETRSFFIFASNSKPKQKLETLVNRKRVRSFSKKYWTLSRQSFQFSGKNRVSQKQESVF